MSLGVGIIGAGGISRAHARGYQQRAGRARIVAVADIAEERARQAAAEWGATHAFTDYRRLLELKEVDAVSVCTYNEAHCEPTVRALEAGKHVLVEKPMASNTADAWRMVQASQASGRLLMVEMKWRFMPELQAGRQTVACGALGRPYYAEAIGWQRRGIPGGSFIRRETAGGGALMDNGVYTLDAVLYMLGHPRPLTVSGTAGAVFGRSPGGTWNPDDFTVEDTGTAYVRLEGGITVFFAHAWAIDFPDQWQMRIAGSAGSVEVYPFSTPRLRLMQGGYGDLQEVTPASLPEGSMEVPYAVGQFVDAVLEGRPSPVPGDTFLYTNVIFDGLYESSRTGREVTVSVPC
ncbi:MAG: Gfo/Idh/MocA family oxidoreductase [Candidatus Latescibacterota bacterium]